MADTTPDDVRAIAARHRAAPTGHLDGMAYPIHQDRATLLALLQRLPDLVTLRSGLAWTCVNPGCLGAYDRSQVTHVGDCPVPLIEAAREASK